MATCDYLENGFEAKEAKLLIDIIMVTDLCLGIWFF